MAWYHFTIDKADADQAHRAVVGTSLPGCLAGEELVFSNDHEEPGERLLRATALMDNNVSFHFVGGEE